MGVGAAFLLLAAWSVTMPLYSGPDEPSQAIRAAALVHGQLIGTPLPGHDDPYSGVTVPATFGKGQALIQCYLDQPAVPASCASHVKLTAAPDYAGTSASRYPPLYYAVVGLPTLVDTSESAAFLMRLVGALGSAILLGLAYMCVRSWSRRSKILVGMLVALTPTVLYLGSVVNPNGLEISAAICLWVSGLVLVLDNVAAPPRGLVFTVAGSAAILTLTRGLSPLWTAIILVCLGFLGGFRALWLLFLERTDVKVACAVVIVAALIAGGWILLAHALWVVPSSVLPHGSETSLIVQLIDRTPVWLQQMVGGLGWLDTNVPTLTIWAWEAALVLLLVMAALSGNRRQTGVLVGLVALCVFLPVVLSTPNVRTEGIVWQGRYTLPLAVGVPLLAGAMIGRRRTAGVEAMSGVVIVLVTVAGIAGFFEAVRRYAVGVNGPVFFLLHPKWSPVEGTVPAVIWYALAAVAIATVIFRRSRSPETDGDSGARRLPHGDEVTG